MRVRPQVTWTWTNWTFGVYYAKFARMKMWGIDIGPLEFYWKKVKSRG